MIGTTAVRFTLENSKDFFGFWFLVTLKFLFLAEERCLCFRRLSTQCVDTGYAANQRRYKK